MQSYKRYYTDTSTGFNQLVETPASKEKTEFRRFLVTAVISAVSAVAAIVAAVASVLSCLR
nr:MAG TPA: hypothetical protein [Caudoviricetes sp.]